MRTARSLKWLLSMLPLVTVLLVIQGQAATDSPLVAAAKSGDLVSVRSLIAKRVNVNEPGADGSTALLWASVGWAISFSFTVRFHCSSASARS